MQIRSGQQYNNGKGNASPSHRNNSTLYNKTISITFPEHSDDTRTMIEASLRGLDKLFKPNIAYAQKLMQTLDSINARYGRHALHFAGQGLDAQAPWRMKQQFRSSKFTSAWDKLPVAKA